MFEKVNFVKDLDIMFADMLKYFMFKKVDLVLDLDIESAKNMNYFFKIVNFH
jgi:hypothetical protein